MSANDGFFKLIRKVPVQQEDKDKKKKKAKKDKKPKEKPLPKYKKGTWKRELLGRIKRMFVSPSVEDFHFTKSENLLISFAKKDSVVMASRSRFKKNRIKELLKSSDDTTVLIHATDDIYIRMPAKTYLKLCEVDRIAIDVHFFARMDYDEIIELDQREYNITHIGELADFIVQHRAGINGVYDMEAKCYGFQYPRYKIKTMVLRTDREVETYKDINDFMEAYGLLEF